jgi:hypothetical protein
MVHKIIQNGERLYICEVCSLTYEERSWAEKCQDFCTKHSACSLEITRHAIQMK